MGAWSAWWLTWACAGVAAELYVVLWGEHSDRLSQNVWMLQSALPGGVSVWRFLTAALLLLLAWHFSYGPRH